MFSHKKYPTYVECLSYNYEGHLVGFIENLSLVSNKCLIDIAEVTRPKTVLQLKISSIMKNYFVSTAGTPYAGGHFRVKLVLGKSFPSEPPKGFFLTKIFHPNVAKNGEICVNTLKRDWKAEYGIKHILLVSFFLVLSLFRG